MKKIPRRRESGFKFNLFLTPEKEDKLNKVAKKWGVPDTVSWPQFSYMLLRWVEAHANEINPYEEFKHVLGWPTKEVSK